MTNRRGLPAITESRYNAVVITTIESFDLGLELRDRELDRAGAHAIAIRGVRARWLAVGLDQVRGSVVSLGSPWPVAALAG